MKCSKCGYLGFETADRCRNCGYEFSLAADYDLTNLDIRSDSESRPLDDFALVDAALAGEQRPAAPVPGASGVLSLPQPVVRRTPSAMPLFAPGIDDDTPLITKASPPRAPLSVRKSTPDVARLRSIGTSKASTLDLGFDLDATDTAAAPRMYPSERAQAQAPRPTPSGVYEDAGVARRVIAAAVDSVILLAIDVLVIYFTMQICGIGLGEFDLLPKAPLVVFLVVQNVGYLVAFTTGGQTLGKMATAIKVVPDSTDVPLDIGCALKRTVVWLVLAFPAGLGLLSALFDRDHRGLHDHFAGTRVVRASA